MRGPDCSAYSSSVSAPGLTEPRVTASGHDYHSSFLRQSSLYTHGCPGTRSVDLAGLELEEVCLLLPLES